MTKVSKLTKDFFSDNAHCFQLEVNRNQQKEIKRTNTTDKLSYDDQTD